MVLGRSESVRVSNFAAKQSQDIKSLKDYNNSSSQKTLINSNNLNNNASIPIIL